MRKETETGQDFPLAGSRNGVSAGQGGTERQRAPWHGHMAPFALLARFEIYQEFQLPSPLPYGMATFLYLCPNTALNVQGWVADDPTEGKAETYEPVTCTACTQVHLVNPKTGKVLGLTKSRPPRRRGYWELVKEMGPRKRKKLLGR